MAQPCADGPEGPSARLSLDLADLARILDPSTDLGAGTRRRLARYLRRQPACAAVVAELDALSADAGLGDNLLLARQLNERFDRLLAAGEWRDPAEVLGAMDWEEAFYPEMIRIAEARAGRSDAPERYRAVRDRLVAADVRAMEDYLRVFVRRLVHTAPRASRRVLDLMREVYDWRHGEIG